MSSESYLAEIVAIVPAIIPVDLSTADNNGDWVSMKNYDHCTIMFFAAIGTAGQDPVFKLQQAKDVAGTGIKDLLFTTIYHKAGALLTAVSDFTKAVQAAATSYVNTDHAEVQKLYAVEIDAAMLDIANGFDCVQLSVADVGANAQLGCGLYILSRARYKAATVESAIVD